jgi:hypothetical protein
MFHKKTPRPTGKQGVYGGYQSWINRAGRFRSLRGPVDFKSFSVANVTIIQDGLYWNGIQYQHPEDMVKVLFH